MKTVCKLNKCNGCMACVSVCPKNCIKIKDSIESLNAEIDEIRCIDCKKCEKACPNIGIVNKKKPINWKQGWAMPEIRINSTSGGVASAIIESFIKIGGYVSACHFKNGNFVFEITNNLEIAKTFSGSKYVKSNPTGIYDQIKDRLKTHKVLFIGLPCQVAAVKNYFKEEDNLYTIDLICHGTPSAKLLEGYLLEKGYQLSKFKNISFRGESGVKRIDKSKKIILSKTLDYYLCAFLESISLTENCYSCQFACLERTSDITLGDSWGTHLKKEVKKGVSLILVQTNKGKVLLEMSELELVDIDLNIAINNNHQLSHPSILSAKRKRFFNLVKNGKTFRFATLCTLPGMVIKQKIKSVLILLHLVDYHDDEGYRITLIK